MPWKTITPEQAGLDGSALNTWRDALASRGTTGLLVIRRGSVAFEWYAPNSGVDKPHGTASLAKALVGGMSLLTAISDGLMKSDDLAGKYIPEWTTAPKSKITIRELATHTSGIEDAEQGSLPHDQLPGWKGAFWKRSPDPFSVALQAPVIFEPASSYAYSNPGMAALAYAVTASLKPGDIRSVLKTRIFDPLGIPESAWSIGYGRGYELDGLTLYANWGGAAFTARAAARVGQLMMLQGTWSGRELVRRSAVKEVVTYAGMPKPPRTTDKFAPASGLAWYTNSDGIWPAVPRDAIAGAGAGHQVLVVIPSLDLVVVRNGDALNNSGRSEFWTPVYEKILQPLMAAVKERGPYPPSPVIRKLTFIPDVRRTALDSDNWPITWGDDDAQYTSYGDGWGFDPRTERKLGMGFARITGPPDRFQGVNLRSDGERLGDGAKSQKASGILIVDGVLYLLVRNVGNAQLLWSNDHGRTWKAGFKLETGFGSPTFLNFGRGYRGSRDDFVYVYSQDGPSAYESDNQMELARVPKRRIRDRAAWEFLRSVDENGHAVWTSDITQHGAVFTYPGNCRRSDVIYNPGIRRYLLALAYNVSGDWGIFDAPEPWGPWTTVFHNDAFTSETGSNAWGIPGTHGYRLPAKWISGDGLTMTLIFSGVRLKDTTYDAFCTRTIQLER
jgi:CubicO group peptidase (beta-lactamase class C family)